ncbi:MAG: hypothetical protein U5O39_08200 [Gammaproteobacteria bacterium]|nr:hypothetical protein [Gammaproteobacteria bacterium]
MPAADGKDQHFRLEGKIVRVMESGVGINFPDGIPDDAITALLNHSNSMPLEGKPSQAGQPEGGDHAAGTGGKDRASLEPGSGDDSGITRTDARRIIAKIRREVARILPEMNSAFFSYMDEELLKLARDSKTNAEQSDYFAAMSNLEKAKKQVGETFMREVLDQIDNPRDLQALLEARRESEQARKGAAGEPRQAVAGQH